ncbi:MULTISPECIES: pyridoxamine kinase [Oscillospiraceae]|uniref:pyridoxamine kinase n=1 Tax=Oscillospiraceae TaxID=216572 RepID=UPI000B398ABF|nr:MULTISPECIES: pyridoxamine kinase [Oscillospiraceae]MBM6723168.1 pyridoxamine kinase [Pseudoflavonifractor phocaeensis]OUO30473.1 pyridoxal kinase [Flavonifractor sp. An306]
MARAPRVAAIQDISGFGRCSMTVVLPVLAAMGSQCCPLPTAYLSAHTAFPASDKATFLDMTGQMAGTTSHWAELGVAFDAVYSGFVGSEGQIGLIEAFYRRFRGGNTLVLVDPVMGDHGRPYRTYTPDMCRRMGQLAAQADVITPNLTEAALLLGEDYQAVPGDEAGLRRWLERLSLAGKRSVVLTGVSLSDGEIGAGFFDRRTGRTGFAMARQEPAQFPGTGDLFASVVLGALLRGEGLEQAAQRGANFVQRCVAHTLAQGTPILEGVQFEPLLGALMEP